MKQKAIATALIIIETEKDGIRADDLASMLTSAFGSRYMGISVGTLGQFLIPSVSSGIIYKSRTIRGNTVYHYSLDLETL